MNYRPVERHPLLYLTKIITLLLPFIFVVSVSAQSGLNEVVSDTISLELREHTSADTNICNVFPKSYSTKTVALVLSGGGARGLAQLGVIKEFENAGIRPDLIVGTSIGSIVGGFYSCGYTLDEMHEIFTDFDWDIALSLTNKYQRTTLFPEQKKLQDRSLLTIPLDGITPVIIPAAFSNGLYLSEKINSYLLNARYHPAKSFSDLKIPFAAVATDINSGKKIVMTKGNISESIKASFTFPLLYSPIQINGKNLVDGGLTANIPTDAAKSLGADYIIAVNTTSPLRRSEELSDPISTADQILSITMAQLNELQIKGANVVITPDLGDYILTNFSNVDFLTKQGEISAQKYLTKIRESIDSLERSASRFQNNFIMNSTLKLTFTGDLTDTLFRISDLMPDEFEKYTDIEANLRNIYKTGYFSNVEAVVERQGLTAHVNYLLSPNPVFNGFRLFGVIQDEIKDEIKDRLNSYTMENSGKTMNYNSLVRIHDNILGDIRKSGLSFVEFKRFRFNYETNEVDIELTDGTIDKVVLEGNNNTNDNVIIRELSVSKGVTATKEMLDLSLQNVMSTNLFQQVSLEYEPDPVDGKSRMVVSVSEKNTKALRLSIRIDNERNFQALADLRDDNLFGTAIEAGLTVGGGLRNRLYRAEVKSNQVFSLPFTFNLNGFYQFRDIYTYQQINNDEAQDFEVVRTGEYRNIASGFSILAGTQLERLGTIYGQLFLQNLDIRIKSGSPNISEDNDFAKFRFGGIFDTQNKWPFPDEGFLLDFNYETAKNLNNGDLSYTKLFFNYKQYFVLAKDHVIRPSLLFGFGDKTTPLSDQFSLGGENSFYGMVEDELRGRQVLAASLEYRYTFPYKIFFDTYFGARYDLGNVWNFADDIRFKDLRQGLGAFLALDTPIGEGLIAVGKSFFTKSGLQEDSFYFGPYVFYFSIGYEF